MNLFPKPPSILQTINELDNWPNFVWEAFKQVQLTPADIGAAPASDLDAHLADYTNPHQVKAEQVFALGGVPAGTTFPTSPASYTLFFRTDLNKLFVYLP